MVKAFTLAKEEMEQWSYVVAEKLMVVFFSDQWS